MPLGERDTWLLFFCASFFRVESFVVFSTYTHIVVTVAVSSEDYFEKQIHVCTNASSLKIK